MEAAESTKITKVSIIPSIGLELEDSLTNLLEEVERLNTGDPSASSPSHADAETNFLKTARELYKLDGVDELGPYQVLLKWLITKHYHVGEALAAVGETLTWRRETLIPIQEEADRGGFSDLQASGKLQWAGHAVDGTPVLVFSGNRHRSPKTASDRNREIRFLLHTLEQGIKEGILVDQMTVIVDRCGTKNNKNDISAMSKFIPTLQKHYPERLSRLFVFRNNTLFALLWRVAKVVVDPITLTKITLSDGPHALLGHIDRENLFSKYGGALADPFQETNTGEDGGESEEVESEDESDANPSSTQPAKTSALELPALPIKQQKEAQHAEASASDLAHSKGQLMRIDVIWVSPMIHEI